MSIEMPYILSLLQIFCIIFEKVFKRRKKLLQNAKTCGII